MFGGKKDKLEAPFDSEGYEQEFEYRVLAVLGAPAMEKELNLMARKGWELVSGMMAGTAHYAYMRRRLHR